MRGDEFRARFKLVKQLTRRGVHSYDALDPQGRSLMVHVVSLPPTELHKLLGLLETLAPGDREKITDRLEVDGVPVLVTEVLDDFETLPRWLVSRRKAAVEESEPSEPGEFTQLFRAVEEGQRPDAEPSPPAEGVAEAEPSDAPQGEAASSGAAAPPPGEAEPASPPAGEFTRLFGPRREAGEERERPATGPPAREVEVETAGEVAGDAGEVDAEAAPAEGEPGDFTRFFGGKTVPSEREAAEEPGRKRPVVRWREDAPPEEEPEPKPVVRWKKKGRPEAAPREGPAAPPPAEDVETTSGEFTKMFRQRAAPPAGQDITKPGKESASPLDRPTGQYLRALGASTPVHEDASSPASPTPIEPPSVLPPVDAPPSKAPAPADGGPSEFTQLVSGGAARPDAPPPAAAPEYDEGPAATGGAPTLRVLVIGLSAIGLAIVVLIILFAVL